MSTPLEVKRACDRCRRRKIKVKCDSTNPCSYCRISSRPCSYDLPIGKRGPKGQRTQRQARSHAAILETSTLGELCDSGRPQLDGLAVLERLQRELKEAIQHEVPRIPVGTIAQHCISIHFRRSFPILHEPSMRADATYFFGADDEIPPTYLAEYAGKDGLTLMRSFAVLTALCAAQSFLHARSTLPYGAAVGPKFLRAARCMLREYEDDDRRDPDATSLQIRMLLSTSLQQYAGENGLAWHLVGEAGLIARRMRLYNESAVSQYSPLEATMLRNSFWMLYVADASATCMKNRAVILHEPLFDSDMDLATFGMNQVPLLESENIDTPGEFEVNISQAFHQMRRTWVAAARLMLAIREYGRLKSDNNPPELAFDSSQFSNITQMYSQFDASLDDIPATLQPSVVFGQDDDTVMEEGRSCYISLRYRLLSAYYYAKLMIIHECRHLGLTSMVGFRDDDSVLNGEEINVARDFINNLQSIPFHYLEELGEPVIEVMRGVGSILLAISQKSENALTRRRALSQLNVLLDVLARLDSQASNKLTAQLSQA
ncbi:hypothetical protein N7499_001629 [Penicillium canescens]|nr:hypothetical protein N7499_001629 [Penicillium canescens]KAJ6165245.1 hypothetical protein N7485_008489 [Penicillium canescens]